MQLRKLKQNSLRFLGHYLLVGAANVLCKSLKINYVNKNVIDELENENKNYILAFWHGSMLLPWYLHKNKNAVALTSKSKDGDLLANLLRSWKYAVIRGSSSTGGDVALGIMVDHARNKKTILLTPDGPRGPYHKFKAGAVVAAKKSGVPLVLVSVGYKNKRSLKSWDKFEVPKSFSKTNVVYSGPIYVDKTLSYEETSKMIETVEINLNEMYDQANSFVH